MRGEVRYAKKQSYKEHLVRSLTENLKNLITLEIGTRNAKR